MKLLIIGSDKKFAHVINHELEKAQWRVRYIRDGDLGQEIALRDQFDLIVLAWSPPKKDGLSIMAELRKQKKQTPILMLAAGESMKEVILSLDSSSDACVSEPVDIVDVMAKMRALLERSQWGKSLERSMTFTAAAESPEILVLNGELE
jgi:DNA-binding response OmpR family regulator